MDVPLLSGVMSKLVIFMILQQARSNCVHASKGKIAITEFRLLASPVAFTIVSRFRRNDDMSKMHWLFSGLRAEFLQCLFVEVDAQSRFVGKCDDAVCRYHMFAV